MSAQESAAPDGRRTGPGRTKIRHKLAVRDLRVVGVRLVGPRMVRVTVAGPELVDLEAQGPTDHVKVFFPDPTTGHLAAPVLTAEGLERPSSGTLHVRDYTPRAYRSRGPTGPELDLDLVLHGDVGPASTWAGHATVGDRLVVAGPKGSKLVPPGVTSVLLGGDETALPAIARWLELLPVDVAVRVLAEVDSAADETYLDQVGPAGRPLEISWLHRHGRAPGTEPLLERAVQRRGLVDRSTFVWFGGEAGTLRGVRRHLRRDLRLTARQAEVSGYWRLGEAAFDHHAPIDPSDPD
ncbi:siderophore-interacting protein [Actinotalea sp. K2]|uniref:siderophore-interacting protein n=1 Tax=Actinotalea sp. K2 TaxID=2939438 RepID=UPI002016A906|nr:siderophore-interacting protein [Actinotalea sp. K2]MCL3862007.1 siderophore-interacting protein [Actinotalea sp. K2]